MLRNDLEVTRAKLLTAKEDGRQEIVEMLKAKGATGSVILIEMWFSSQAKGGAL
jgi:hypothetical protein